MPQVRRFVGPILDSTAARKLEGTQPSYDPFWSPDGRRIAFWARGKLWTIALSGGPPQIICDSPAGRGGTWNQDDVIVFAPPARVLSIASPRQAAHLSR